MDEAEIIRNIVAFADIKRAEQFEEMPYLFYSRNTSWSGQPCKFCGSATGIHEVGGRYISTEMDEEFEYIDGTQMFFCGDCLERLEKFFQTDME